MAKFTDKIVQQCQNVLVRHEGVPPEDYIKDGVFRGLVWEMVELQVRLPVSAGPRPNLLASRPKCF